MMDYGLIAGIAGVLVLVLVLWHASRRRNAPQEPFDTNAALLAEPNTVSVIAPVKQTHSDIDVEVRMLIDYGNKVAAIRVVREKLGLDLKDAKDLVDAMEKGTPIPIAGNTATPRSQDNADHELRQLVTTGRLIEAIQLVREQKGLDLKEAKAYVERL